MREKGRGKRNNPLHRNIYNSIYNSAFFCAPGKKTIIDEFQPFAEDLFSVFSYKT